MPRHALVLAAFASLLRPGPARPGTLPGLSGTYVLQLTKICQASIAQNEDQALQLTGGGSIAHIFGIAIFTPRTATVSLDAEAASGDLVRLQGTGRTITSLTVHQSAAFATTASSVTLGRDTYHASFAKLTKGIAGTVILGGLDGEGCSEQGMFTRQ
jgi:hypothetical protein